MICKFCQQEIPDISVYCMFCGERLKRSRKKTDVKIPEPHMLPSGNWNIVLRAEGLSKTFPTAEECRTWAKAVRLKMLREKKTEDPDVVLFKDALDNYCELKSNILSPSTIREYLRLKKTALKPLLDRNIYDISENELQMFVNNLAAKYAEKTVRNVYGLVRVVILSVNKNAPVAVQMPQKRNAKLYVPSDDDIKKLYAAVKGTNMELPVLLASAGSLRRGEICALEHADITETGVIVNKDIVRDKDNKWVKKNAPKETSSEREAMLPKEVIAKLKAIDGDPLFKFNPNYITENFGRILKENDIPHFRFHDLRHYWATVAYAAGLPPLYITRNGGWSTMDTPNRVYISLTEDKNKELAKAINKKFKSNYK